jgi:hypothetical protein
MPGQHREDDDVAFYAAALKRTYELIAGTGGDALAEEEGALPPGRYLLQLRTGGRQYVWITVGKFEKGKPLTPSLGTPAFPMSNQGIVAVEYHIRKGYNDSLAAITEDSNATLYLTLVSHGA